MKHNLKGNSGISIHVVLIFCIVFLMAVAVPAFATEDSPYPPPGGKVWIKSGGKWAMVPAPPNEGPHRWTGNGWARIESAPPGRKWVPPHWDYDTDKWIVGYWKTMRSEDETQAWAPGHWAGNGHWIEGHWEAGERRSSGIDNDTWIPGVHSPRPPLRPRAPVRPRSK